MNSETQLPPRLLGGSDISRRLWPLDGAKLCAQARRRVSLEDFGNPPLQPALSILTKSLEQEAELHPLGRLLMRTHLRSLLETRLRLVEAWRGQQGELDVSRIEQPVFIIGMPRTGSTFLHELLSEDPGNRAPRVWEVMFPLPMTGERDRKSSPRVRKAAACLWFFRRLAPGADSVYPMRACTPHECVAIQSYTFLTEEFVSTCRIPSYEAFLHKADLSPAYAWEKRFLQHLELGGPAKRWMLKSPDHVMGLEALFSVFPDAAIIHTLRNPLEVVQSSIQLTQVLQGLYARRGDPAHLARREARVLAERMDRFIRFREQHPELADRFVDVKYSELVSRPLAVVRRIYRQLEIPFTDIAARRMSDLASNRSRYHRGQAHPSLADLGLDPAAEAQRFERYCSRFELTAVSPDR
jgi:Sulfotransferase family